MRRRTSLYVYAAMLPSNEIKIGYTSDIKGRMRDLGATLIGSIEGDRSLERMMHNRFRPFWLHHELFMPSGEICEFFGNHAAYRPNPKYAGRLLDASFRSAYGKATCRSLLYQDLLPQGFSRYWFDKKRWWHAFHPPAFPIWKRSQHPSDRGRWYAERDESLVNGDDWDHVSDFARKNAEIKAAAVRRPRIKQRLKLKDQFSGPWLQAMEDADVTRRYLARQARLKRRAP